ncbi:MAG TPA: hypothetical protein VFF40_09940 [Acidimicrobiia bacterium]|nr:hypothetical protein [Acidimicrobiia bacterium]
MTSQDPDEGRHNPLFAVDPEAAPRIGDTASVDELGDAGRERAESEHSDPLAGAAGSAVGPLLGALEEAGPEAAEHLVNAAHELTLAVKVVVDALERGLAEQREALTGEVPSARPPAGTRAPGRARSGVRRIDVE